MNSSKYRVIYVGLAIIILLLMMFNILFGAVKIPLSDAVDILLGVEGADVKASWGDI